MAKSRATVLESTFRAYTLGPVIGEGGAGRVYGATDEGGTRFAIKILHGDRATTERRKRFQNEIAFCVRNTHPNVLTVLDHGVATIDGKTSPFYVMRCYDGSLRSLMQSPISPDRALRLFGQLLDGVEAAHWLGVVHRDLKPENVLFDRANDRVCVADFGIAHFREEEIYTAVETNPSAKLANLQYAAPEQRNRGNKVGPTADIYALGLILNELFTHQVPAGTDYALIATHAPGCAYLDEIVADMLKQSPAARPQSIEAIKMDLIGRKKSFVAKQQLLESARQVVPATVLSDPLLDDPPRIIDFDWENGTLVLHLSRAVSPDWVSAFQNIGSRTSEFGADVTDFRFRGNQATVAARHDRVQAIINNFKGWLPRTTAVYEMRLQQSRERAEREERERLQREREELERRAALRQSIRL